MLSIRRRELVSALMGPEHDDLRLTHLNVADVRKDASLLDAELKARGFFPGRRVVVIDAATDGLTKSISGVLETTTTEDAFMILTPGRVTCPFEPQAIVRTRQ